MIGTIRVTATKGAHETLKSVRRHFCLISPGASGESMSLNHLSDGCGRQTGAFVLSDAIHKMLFHSATTSRCWCIRAALAA